MYAARIHRWATAGLWLLGLITLILSCALAWLVSSSLSVAQETKGAGNTPAHSGIGVEAGY